jgi:hypothetical protein
MGAGAAAIGAAVLVVGAVVVILLGTGSARPVVPPTHPVVLPSHAAIQPPRHIVPPSSTHPAAPDALAALSSYWQSIGRHDFAAAYADLAPGAVPQTEAQWVPIEEQTRIQSVRFEGHTVSSSGAEATVDVVSLVTQDTQFGCRDWTGAYQMINQGGRWLISRAEITPGSCQSG